LEDNVVVEYIIRTVGSKASVKTGVNAKTVGFAVNNNVLPENVGLAATKLQASSRAHVLDDIFLKEVMLHFLQHIDVVITSSMDEIVLNNIMGRVILFTGAPNDEAGMRIERAAKKFIASDEVVVSVRVKLNKISVAVVDVVIQNSVVA